MLDTLAVSHSLTAAEFAPAQAAAITAAVQQAAEHSDHVTTDQFKAGLAELRTEVAGYRAEVTVQIADVAGQIAEQRADTAEVRTAVANLETRLIRWMVGTVIATATLTVGILRFIGG